MQKKVKEEDVAVSKITPSYSRARQSGNSAKILTWVAVVVVCFLGFSLLCGSGDKSSTVTISGDKLEIVKGDNTYRGKLLDSYSEELRVYGITDNRKDDGWSPVGYADYIFMASVWTGNTTECEREDAMSASMVNVIVTSKIIPGVVEKLEEMTDSRRRAMVTGREVSIDEFYFKGEDHSDSLTSQGNLDPKKALLVESISIVGD